MTANHCFCHIRQSSFDSPRCEAPGNQDVPGIIPEFVPGIHRNSYTLMENLRRRALEGTELARAQATTIRLKLLKIRAQLKMSARRFVVTMPTSYPLQGLFQQAWTALRC